MTVRDLDRRAVLRSIDIVSAVTSDQLGLPTPCVGWTLNDLLVHMIREHRGFAASALGNTDDLSVWDDQPLGDDPAGAYAKAAHAAIDAFAIGGSPTFWLPLVRTAPTIEAERAISFHLLDYVVHGWDVAASIDASRDLGEDDLVAATVAVALAEVPDHPRRAEAGASFSPVVPPDEGDSAQDRLLRLLGRDPRWAPPAG